MSTENLVSIKIDSAELGKINKAVSELNATLKPLLTSLSADQRREIPKMGDGTEPFVGKAMDYAKTNPEFAPPYMNVPEMEVDLKAVNELKGVYRPLLQLIEQLDDSIMLSGSEAYIASLAYYNSVKMATRMNVPNAKPIYDDLKKRFAKVGSNNTNGSSIE